MPPLQTSQIHTEVTSKDCLVPRPHERWPRTEHPRTAITNYDRSSQYKLF